MTDKLKCRWCGCDGHIATGEGNACAEALIKKVRALENAYIEQGVLLEAIETILDGKEPSDFEMSYPIVRRVYDEYYKPYPHE